MVRLLGLKNNIAITKIKACKIELEVLKLVVQTSSALITEQLKVCSVAKRMFEF